MNKTKNILFFYINGFKNMTVGKTLWKIIFIKLAIIFVFLNYFIDDKSLSSEYSTEQQKIDFVYGNLIKKGE